MARKVIRLFDKYHTHILSIIPRKLTENATAYDLIRVDEIGVDKGTVKKANIDPFTVELLHDYMAINLTFAEHNEKSEESEK